MSSKTSHWIVDRFFEPRRAQRALRMLFVDNLVAGLVVLVLGLGLSTPLVAKNQGTARTNQPEDAMDHGMDLSALALRGIGPAVMGGRIADIAVHPHRPATWYLAVGSGGVWKTENAGTTWTPLFDDQASYSIGCVTLDPSNPEIVWVGTGENVSGRHVGWGDGVYKSLDGGQTWQSMGLQATEHIGAIVVDPTDGDTVYVAAEGPLWSSGGERGLYKSTDGGSTWTLVLDIDSKSGDPDSGVTDLEMDPRNPEVLYAASYQRRRRVWSFLAGGPGSGIHKSIDGGATWRRLEGGLPSADLGKIGLAVSPANPDVVYATVEAAEDDKGLYRSTDRGETWQRRNSYISGGTGPHYYQELVASPHDVDRVYQMDVFLHATHDGGATMPILGDGRQKHSDNHSLWIDPQNPKHLLAGTDGGLYETFDDGITWRHFGNLPISQFYKLAVDNAEPFYNVLAGAQDLGTLLGPSRTTSSDGVRNQDWTVPLGADGYACAFDREFPDVMYMQWQVGNLTRVDRRTGEILHIQPQPAAGEVPERWNWDAPLILSPHASGRLYYGSQRLWRSDDRGNSWTAISDDLTHGTTRYELEMIDRVPSIDELYDNGAMSWYSTTTALDESPLVEGLLYVGTDDGRIQVRDGGTWRAAGALPGVPDRSFVQEVKASQHREDSVFAVLDAHKIGDYRPLLLASDDRGRSWRSIAGSPGSGGLPNGVLVWSVEQDHEVESLLFAGTEIGLFVTLDGGEQWTRLNSGLPTIALRDLVIQRRDSDLVAASFGRGIFVLDDYSPLRQLAKERSQAKDDAGEAVGGASHLFAPRDAWLYVPWAPMQALGQPSQGSAAFRADNPPFGAVFTYRLEELPKSRQSTRREAAKQLKEQGEDVPFPGWQALRDEREDLEPRVFLTVRDSDGKAVRRIEGSAEPGLHRLAWDLRWPAPDAVDLTPVTFRPPWVQDPQGPLVVPGTYRADLSVLALDGTVRTLGEPQTLVVKTVPGASLGDPQWAPLASFHAATRELMRRIQGAGGEMTEAQQRLVHLQHALTATPAASADLFARLASTEQRLADLERSLSGDPLLRRHDEPQVPSIWGRVGNIVFGHWDTRQNPTTTQRQSLEVAQQDFEAWRGQLSQLLEGDLRSLEADLEAAGAPWTPGRRP